jgi:succinate dehydrogenase/fumarate reductase-like Fe-S protein
VAASRLRALSYLGYRALVAQPLKRLRQEGAGLERFLQNYSGEGLAPTRPDDRAMGEAASACISCGLCEVSCDLASAVPAVRSLGLHAAFRLYGKNSALLPLAREALEVCAGCGACEGSCPTGVPISRIARYLLVRACELSPRHAAPP